MYFYLLYCNRVKPIIQAQNQLERKEIWRIKNLEEQPQ